MDWDPSNSYKMLRKAGNVCKGKNTLAYFSSWLLTKKRKLKTGSTD
jgi:hypothetical protein